MSPEPRGAFLARPGETLVWCDDDGVNMNAAIAGSFGKLAKRYLDEGEYDEAAKTAELAGSYGVRAVGSPGGHWENPMEWKPSGQ